MQEGEPIQFSFNEKEWTQTEAPLIKHLLTAWLQQCIEIPEVTQYYLDCYLTRQSIEKFEEVSIN